LSNKVTERPYDEADDGLSHMLAVAERLRVSNGGVLDEPAIMAVAEATNTPVEYVRLAVRLRPETQKGSRLSRLRAEYLALDPLVRNNVYCASMGALTGILHAVQGRIGQELYGLPGMIAILALCAGLLGFCTAKDTKTAAASGGLMGATYFITLALASIVLRPPWVIPPAIMVPLILGGPLVGMVLNLGAQKARGKLGLKDPAAERQELLRQLVSLQEKLRSGEQSITFLSVDIVGSTRMKTLADPLSVEFTFTEYHAFVDAIARRYGGRVHSTAGDGVVCAFDHPQQAFGAARTIQTGLFELNTFRNKIGVPLQLRQGIHAGKVVTPQAGDITSVNFAHVIDVCAHIQKITSPGTVAVSDAAAMYLPGGPDAVGAERFSTEDVSGSIWTPRKVAAVPALGAPPPTPGSEG
jgi:class 3 adenylate cyclase